MAGRTTRRDSAALNPMFPIPEGMEDEFFYDEDAAQRDLISDEIDESALIDEFGDFELEEIDDDTDYTETPDTPQIFGVIQQTVRFLPDGTQLVDVILSVEDVPGATYEVGVTRL